MPSKNEIQSALEIASGLDTVNLDPAAAYPVTYAREELHAALLAREEGKAIEHLKAARDYIGQALAALPE